MKSARRGGRIPTTVSYVKTPNTRLLTIVHAHVKRFDHRLLFFAGVTAIVPVLNPVQRNVVVSGGCDVILTCLGRGVYSFDTVVLWKFDGHEIKRNTNKKAYERFLPKGRGNFSLHITNVTERDVGKYTCIARVANFGKPDVVESTINVKLYESGKLTFMQ